MARKTPQEREALLLKIKKDFDERLAKIASDPHEWVTFIDQVAVFGARYSVGNQLLLMMQAEERGIQPRFFLPYGKKDGSTGWLRHRRRVSCGQTAFKIWAPLKRRPSEQQAQEWEAAGRKVRRDPSGRPSVQLVGFTLANTFDISQTEGQPFEVPTARVVRRQRLSGAGRPRLLDGDDPTGVYDDLLGLIRAAGYRFELAPPGSRYLGQSNGVTVGGLIRLVRVRDDMSAAQRLKTTMHELAHILCGHLTDTRTGEVLHRGRKEAEAESVTHIVCAALGLDTTTYSDAYVMTWADGDIDLVKQCADTVLRVARQLLADLATGPEDLDNDESAVSVADRVPSPRRALAVRHWQERSMP